MSFWSITSAYSRSIKCNINSSSSAIACGCSCVRARRPNSSSWPTRINEGATRVEIATASLIIWSGSCALEPSEYQGRCTVSVLDTYKLSDRDVGTPSACMCSCARNSRTLDRSTARPSAPRQYGVRPPPLSCISQRLSLITASSTETARPSP